MGTTVLPLPQVVARKKAWLAVDDGDGLVGPTDTLAYTITVVNRGAVTLFNVKISDTVPLSTDYVLGSTAVDGTPVTDDVVPPAATEFPLDEGGLNVGTVLIDQELRLTFRVTNDDFPPNYTAITNTATVDTSTGPFRVEVVTPIEVNETSCALELQNPGGASVDFYIEGDTVYVEVIDDDKDVTGGVDSISVTLVNLDNGDRETLALLETGGSTGVFKGNLPSSPTSGTAIEDGTLWARPCDTIQATYTDPRFGDTCSDTAIIAAPAQTKVLYLGTDGAGTPD
jgi:uncharacterized repeat protein (TIGR01451 family)